jgi:hypothetical protein
VLVAVSLLLGAAMIPSLTWGMCFLVTNEEVVVRRHAFSQSVSIEEVASALVKERLLSLKPIVEIDLELKSGQWIRTPLGAARSMAGRAGLAETSRALNAELANRRTARAS